MPTIRAYVVAVALLNRGQIFMRLAPMLGDQAFTMKAQPIGNSMIASGLPAMN
jgi:hypothetical protein